MSASQPFAKRGEQQAQKLFEQIAAGRAPKQVKAAAREMAGEEREHVELIRAWMKKVPPPAAGWDEDPDPPQANE